MFIRKKAHKSAIDFLNKKSEKLEEKLYSAYHLDIEEKYPFGVQDRRFLAFDWSGKRYRKTNITYNIEITLINGEVAKQNYKTKEEAIEVKGGLLKLIDDEALKTLHFDDADYVKTNIVSIEIEEEFDKEFAPYFEEWEKSLK